MQEVSSTGPRQQAEVVMETSGTVFPYMDRQNAVNNLFIIFY